MMPKLLLADDSITVQRVIALTFQGEGIEVIAVGDGDLAVDAIDRERPQIVLADLSMPGRDGYAVAEYVKRSPELAKDIRVVLLTGAAEPVEEARSRALGIDGVLSKPFEPHVATALVRRLLNEAPNVPGFRTVTVERAGAPDVPAAVPPPLPADDLGPGDTAIAVDDYFRRLDEALATAGLVHCARFGRRPRRHRDARPRPPDRFGRRRDDVSCRAAVTAAAAAPTDDAASGRLAEAGRRLLGAARRRRRRRAAPSSPARSRWSARRPRCRRPPSSGRPGRPRPRVEAAAETVALQAVAADAAEAAADGEARPARCGVGTTPTQPGRRPRRRRTSPGRCTLAATGGEREPRPPSSRTAPAARRRRPRCAPTCPTRPPSTASTSTSSPTPSRRRSCIA